MQGFLDHIRTLLHSQEVEVSYFAAGILAHLTSRGEKAWTLSPDLRSSLLEQLVGDHHQVLECIRRVCVVAVMVIGVAELLFPPPPSMMSS